MTEFYKIDPGGIIILKKRILKFSIPFILLALVIGVSSSFSDLEESKMPWKALLFSQVFVIIAIGYAFYRIGKKQTLLLKSYQLTISSYAITREQANFPDITIELQDIQFIRKNKKGVFIIQGKLDDRIYVPAQIEKYEQLEQTLNTLKPIEPHTEKLFSNKRIWIPVSMALIIIVTAFITSNSILLYLAITLIMGFFMWAFIYSVRNKNTPTFSKVQLIFVIIAFSGVYFTLMKRVYDKDQLKHFNYKVGSENVSYLLDSTLLNYSKIDTVQQPDYKADPQMEWVINLDCIDSEPIKQKDMLILFDQEWMEDYTYNVYGFSNTKDKWIQTSDGDSLELYDSLQIGISLLATYNSADTNFTTGLLDRYVDALQASIVKLSAKLKLSTTEPSVIALERAKRLLSLYSSCNKKRLFF